MTELTQQGGCLCGQVRYEVTGAPVDTTLCFCTQCRRQTGSAMPAFATWPADRLALLRGEPRSYRSSERAVRQFCQECGSALFWLADGSGQVDVFLGSLDAPERIPPPRMQIWTRHRMPWVASIPGVPDHPEGGDAGA